jgi:hypothetical protein
MVKITKSVILYNKKRWKYMYLKIGLVVSLSNYHSTCTIHQKAIAFSKLSFTLAIRVNPTISSIQKHIHYGVSLEYQLECPGPHFQQDVDHARDEFMKTAKLIHHVCSSSSIKLHEYSWSRRRGYYHYNIIILL